MQAVLLVGGKGTRMQERYPDRPKALVPLAGKPFLAWQMDWLERSPVTSVHLAAGHLADHLREWIAGHSFKRTEITLSAEPSPMGTGGGLKFIEPFLQSDPFMVLNGDTLLPGLDFNAFLEAHNGSGLSATLAVARMEEAGRYGTVEFDDHHVIRAFREKADRDAGWVNGGVYFMNRAILDNLEPGHVLSIEQDIFPHLVKQAQLGAYPSQPPLLDMGTPEGLTAMERYLVDWDT